MGCSKKNEDSTPSAALGKGGTILAAANTALESSGTLMESASLVSRTSKSSPAVPFADPCPGFGTDASSTADSIYCMLTTNSGSPETAQGALALISQIVNGIESRVTFAFASTATDHENISFSVTTSDGTSAVTVSVREQALSNGVWDNKIDICMITMNGQSVSPNLADCVSNGFFFTIYLKETADVLAFKGVSRMNGPKLETILFHLDRANGEMRFNTWSLDNGNQHRYYVKGAISSSFEITSLEKAAFAHARASYDNADNPTTLANWSAAYAFYDGTVGSEDLCINYKTSTGTDNDWTISGDCTVDCGRKMGVQHSEEGTMAG